MEKKIVLRYSIAVILAAFGLITLFLSSSVIFDLFGIREKEGNYVLFVVISNFVSSLFYLFATYGFIKNKIWTAKLLYVSAGVLTVAFAGLLVHINSGGIYETKTIWAMVFRIIITLTIGTAALLIIKKSKS